jgi:hypothetical protein
MSDIKYKEINGTSYHEETGAEMVELLERLRANRIRCRFHWGDAKTGQDWGDVYDVTGHIGRSTGASKIPLLIHNVRSLGGGALLDHCIVKITHAKGKGHIYQHPAYKEAII